MALHSDAPFMAQSHGPKPVSGRLAERRGGCWGRSADAGFGASRLSLENIGAAETNLQDALMTWADEGGRAQ